MLTKITLEFLTTTGACPEGVQWFRDRPELRGASWQTVCAALKEDSRHGWSEWVREAVARHGTAEDRAALRNDPSEWVRAIVARCGTAEDRAVLRSDSSAWVRELAARYGTAEDRATRHSGTRWQST